MSNNRLQRRANKSLTRKNIEKVLVDHAQAITMSAQAHKNASDFLLKLLDVLELEVKKKEDGTIDIVRKSGIVLVK